MEHKKKTTHCLESMVLAKLTNFGCILPWLFFSIPTGGGHSSGVNLETILGNELIIDPEEEGVRTVRQIDSN